MKSSVFTISLDFELHWGGFEKWPLESYKTYFDNTRKVIPQLLTLFERSGIHVTWATVGLLIHKNRASLEKQFPQQLPTYQEKLLSAYHYIESIGIGDNESDDPYHYAHSLVEQILDTHYQELGTHTFAHYYCNEIGQTPQQFEADIQAAKKSAEALGERTLSLVFPRNQFNAEYLKICYQNAIRIVRTNPVDWWWQIDSTQSESKWKRLNRGLDAYFPIGGKTSYSIEAIKKVEGVYLLPASRLLRPYRPSELVLNDIKIKRIKKEMTKAAQNNEMYHLWWHPHNFGHYPQQSLGGLVEIANHFDFLRSEYNMISLNMGEIAHYLDHGHVH